MAPKGRPSRTEPRVLFVTAALSAVGGIPSYSRSMIEALEQSADVHTLDLQLSGRRADQLRGLLRSCALLVRLRPDVLLLGHVGFGPIGMIWKAFGGRYVILAYGIDVWGPPSRLQTEWLLGADRVWAISTFTGIEVLRTAPGARLGPILGGNIDEHFFQSHEPVAGPFRVLVVSRLEDLQYKGIDTAIDAVELLAADTSLPRLVELRIAGAGPAGEELNEMVRDRDRANVVRVLGRITDAELLAEYRHADVLVLVSRHHRGAEPKGEGLGLVALEAGAAGTPAIGSTVGGSTDIILDADTGFLVQPGSAERLAEKLQVLISDDDRRAQMGARARELVGRDHSLSAFTTRIRLALAEVLK